jgi:hypothetical protein
MLANQFMYDWNYWELRHKVTFDGDNKLIIINSGETDIDVGQDIYSDWKEWLREDAYEGAMVDRYDHASYDAALRTIGGDPTSGGDFAGDIYFLINGWRILIDNGETVNFTGSIFSDDFDSPFQIGGGSGVISTVSSLVSKIIQSEGAGLSASATSAAIWDALLEDFNLAGSFGNRVQKILTTGKFLALK